MKRLSHLLLLTTAVICLPMVAYGQSNTIQLRNGSNSTTILPSATSTVTVQIPSLSTGTHYLLTSTTNPGSSGAAGSFLTYGATSAQNTTDISATNRLFNVGYSATAVEQNALGGLITSTATGTDKSATALTLAATKTGTGTATALYITNGSLTFTDSDDSHITSFTTGNQAADINYTLPTTAGTNGQALITNGSGSLSWGAAGATTLDGLSDAKVEGTNFIGSMILGHESTGTLSTATGNTAVGIAAMDAITQGDYNTAVGNSALSAVTIGSYNVALGPDALLLLTDGDNNVGIGFSAGREITSGDLNVSIGHQSGTGITTGNENIAIGYGAFYFTTTGSYNVGVGRYTLNAGPSGSNNTALGSNALSSAQAAESNVAVGAEAGKSINSGDFNTLAGYYAGYNLTGGSSNVFIGYQVGSDASIDTESNLLMIDNSNTLTPLIYGDFTNGSELVKVNGTFTSTGDVTLGSGTSATGGSIIMHDNSTGDSFTATISSANLSASRAYTIPEAGADASFVMTEGTQTINGAKTFGSAAVFNTSAKLKSSDGTGGVILQAGAMSNTNITYTLPTADGTSGQVLQTNGTGGLSWATATAVAAINDLTDAVKNIDQFANSMILGHQTTGSLTAASNNTAVGMAAMDAITQGDDNTVFGYNSATALTTGSQNVTIGSGAGSGLTLGSRNILIGYSAGSALTTEDDKLYIDPTNTATPLIQGDFSANTLTFNGATTTTGSVTVQGKSINTAVTGGAKTANTTSPGTAIDAFTGTYEKVAITATSGAAYVQLPAGTEGQVVYLHMTFTASGSNTVTVVNSNSTNTAMVYDGTGADEIIAHMLYTTTKGWVVFSALEYDN